MPAPDTPSTRAVSVVLHDVAPATWSACQTLLDMIDGLGDIPVTLLVVPDYHHRGAIDSDAGFCRAIEARLNRGDELALHGFHHLDDSAPPAQGPQQWLMRNVYTAAEGEFSALDAPTAGALLDRGLDRFDALGWPVHGFVAPAWLMSAGTRSALSASRLQYTSTRTALYRLPDWQQTGDPSLVWSVRSAWRRAASRVVNDIQFRRLAKAPLLRLGLHPADAAHPQAVAYWRQTLLQALQDRTPMTKSAWLAADS